MNINYLFIRAVDGVGAEPMTILKAKYRSRCCPWLWLVVMRLAAKQWAVAVGFAVVVVVKVIW